jgi:V8-like Glu-specific endopeptidase
MKRIIPLLFLLFLMSCETKKSAEEIFDDSASGVVVVLNEFYYEMKLPNGNKVYFTGIDENGDLEGFTDDVNEAANNPQMLTGTAFFIRKDGTLLTNRHVVNPEIDESLAKAGMQNIIRALSDYMTSYMQQLSDEYDSLEYQKNECSYYDEYGNPQTDYDKLSEIGSQQSELQQKFSEASNTRDGLTSNSDLSDVKISANCQIGIAYNNTFVNSDKDFLVKNPCAVVQVSDKEDVDLALIALKDKETPENAYIFQLAGDKSEESFTDNIRKMFSDNEEADGKIKIDQQLYMIGYNAGLILANTKQGIKVQMTSGKVTQTPDGQRLLYSIPTMKGSSGSPVINEYGQVVAVNFAKLSGTDNFNFGIPVERVKEFLHR